MTSVECLWRRSTLSLVGSAIKFTTAAKIKTPAPSTVTADDIEEYCRASHHIIASGSLFGRQLGKVENKGSLHFLVGSFKKLNSVSPAEAFMTYCSEEMSISLCQNINSRTEGQALSPLWREMRYGRITASNLFEASRCKTNEGSLVNVILGATKVTTNNAMERGIKLEGEVLKEVRNRLGVKIEKSGLVLIPESPIFGASPDGISEKAVFEIKCPLTEKSFKTYFNDNQTMPADKYLAQIMLQMHMCKKDEGFFYVAKPCFEQTRDTVILKVKYNKEWLQSVLVNAKNFWISSLFPKLYASA